MNYTKDIKDEKWKDVKGFEGSYIVSNHGRIKSLDRPLIYKDGRKGRISGKLIFGTIGNQGYRCIVFPGNKRCLFHRVVAEAWIGKPDDAKTVNHKDGNKLNNNVDNLEWVTYKTNNAHARETRLNTQDEHRCNLTKFSGQLIKAMKNVHKTGKFTYKEIGEMFAMSAYHVGEIIRGESRTYIDL